MLQKHLDELEDFRECVAAVSKEGSGPPPLEAVVAALRSCTRWSLGRGNALVELALLGVGSGGPAPSDAAACVPSTEPPQGGGQGGEQVVRVKQWFTVVKHCLHSQCGAMQF
jgi:hypothetical protein